MSSPVNDHRPLGAGNTTYTPLASPSGVASNAVAPSSYPDNAASGTVTTVALTDDKPTVEQVTMKPAISASSTDTMVSFNKPQLPQLSSQDIHAKPARCPQEEYLHSGKHPVCCGCRG